MIVLLSPSVFLMSMLQVPLIFEALIWFLFYLVQVVVATNSSHMTSVLQWVQLSEQDHSLICLVTFARVENLEFLFQARLQFRQQLLLAQIFAFVSCKTLLSSTSWVFLYEVEAVLASTKSCQISEFTVLEAWLCLLLSLLSLLFLNTKMLQCDCGVVASLYLYFIMLSVPMR